MERTEEAIDRERTEWVFRLCGGELNDDPATFTDPDGKARTYAYTYDGAPEYAEADFRDRYDSGIDYMTIIACEMFGREPDRLTDANGLEWHRVASFASSGETECPGKGQDDPSDNLPCDLCDETDEHGYIYIGDGWTEIVYRAETHDDSEE